MIPHNVGYHQPARDGEPPFSIILPQIEDKMQQTTYFIIKSAFISLYYVFLTFFFLLMGLLYQRDFTFLSSFSPFPVGSDGAFGPRFTLLEMFSITSPKKLRLSRSDSQWIWGGNAFCWKFPQLSYLQSQIPIAGARCRDESTAEGSFWDGVGEDVAQLV